MIVYGRIAGLNSPASPPLKKTDTSYNNHALHTHKKKTQHGNGQDAGWSQTPHRLPQKTAPPRSGHSTSRYTKARDTAVPSSPNSLFRAASFFSSSLSPSLSLALSLSTFCNFWTNRRAADAFFCAQRTHFIAYQRHAPQRRHEKTCTNTLCPDCRYCLASTAII